MREIILVFLFVFGAIIGSFLCCQARRGCEKKKIKSKRSVCLNCGHELVFYELIPIVSWIFLRGKCRKCGKKIGIAEIISEVLMGVLFLVFGLKFIQNRDIFEIPVIQIIALFVFFVFLSIIVYLAIFDAFSGEMPTLWLFIAIVFGVACFSFNVLFNENGVFNFDSNRLIRGLIGVLILGGLYFLLYVFSKEKLVGGGDYLLATAISFCLSDWWLALFTLFLSNFLAAIVMIFFKKYKLSHKISFGPWMVTGFIIVALFSDSILKLCLL